MLEFREPRTPYLVMTLSAAFFGLLISGALLLLFSAAVFLLMDNFSLGRIFSYISLLSGAFLSTLLLGRYRRRRGLICGLINGALMYLLITAAAVAVTGTAADIKKLLLLMLFGAAGGVIGVNMKRIGYKV